MTASYSRRNSTGAILWVLSLQYYLVQVIAAAAWANTNGYSWANNTISDLANTHCGQYGSRLVCSPLHDVMNVSFIVLGITMIAGAYLLQKQFAANLVAKLGFVGMALAGLGTILVGLFPENTVSELHVTGAALSFVFGNIGMIIIGAYLKRLPRWLRVYTILSGVIGLIALALFLTHTYAGLGIGGMERFVAYPQSIWMIIFGVCVLLTQTES